jgi:hypothetical protein
MEYPVLKSCNQFDWTRLIYYYSTNSLQVKSIAALVGSEQFDPLFWQEIWSTPVLKSYFILPLFFLFVTD